MFDLILTGDDLQKKLYVCIQVRNERFVQIIELFTRVWIQNLLLLDPSIIGENIACVLGGF